jgi:hypothetical protein
MQYMKSVVYRPITVIVCLIALAATASAQQISGEPGSANATVTLDGKQLPPPDPKFGGVIKENAAQSKAWWAPRVVPPKTAPNALLIMTDDVGFGAPSTFGGVWNLVDLKRIRWEGPDALAAGKHTLEFDFKYDGKGAGTLAFNSMSGIGQRGTGVLKVDGTTVGTQKMDHTIPLLMQWDETFDIGSDTGTPVDDKDYQVPFTFTGTLSKLTLKLDRPQLSPADIKLLEQEGQRNNRASE